MVLLPHDAFKSSQSHDRQLARIEVDEAGHTRSFDLAGRASDSKKMPPIYNASSRAKQQALPAPEDRRMSTVDLDALLQDRSRGVERIARLKQSSERRGIDTKGRLLFRQTGRNGTADLVVDTSINAVVQVALANGPGPHRIDYDYTPAGDAVLRRVTRYTWNPTPGNPAMAMTVAVLRASRNGKEILP